MVDTISVKIEVPANVQSSLMAHFLWRDVHTQHFSCPCWTAGAQLDDTYCRSSSWG